MIHKILIGHQKLNFYKITPFFLQNRQFYIHILTAFFFIEKTKLKIMFLNTETLKL